MNRQQRKELEKIQERIADVQSEIQQIRDNLEEIKDEEDEKYENLPEQFQYGEMGEKMEENSQMLESLMDELDNADSTLQDVYDGINELL
jgi:uncharacterized phage infection (PIP) family protein YhgE